MEFGYGPYRSLVQDGACEIKQGMSWRWGLPYHNPQRQGQSFSSSTFSEDREHWVAMAENENIWIFLSRVYGYINCYKPHSDHVNFFNWLLQGILAPTDIWGWMWPFIAADSTRGAIDALKQEADAQDAAAGEAMTALKEKYKRYDAEAAAQLEKAEADAKAAEEAAKKAAEEAKRAEEEKRAAAERAAAEAARKAAEAEAKRLKEIAEQKRKEEEAKKEKLRKEKEAEEKRLKEEAEAEAKRIQEAKEEAERIEKEKKLKSASAAGTCMVKFASIASGYKPPVKWTKAERCLGGSANKMVSVVSAFEDYTFPDMSEMELEGGDVIKAPEE